MKKSEIVAFKCSSICTSKTTAFFEVELGDYVCKSGGIETYNNGRGKNNINESS